MAGAGYRNWSPGDIPTATQFDTFLQEQTVMVFASAAARDTALSVVKAEGMTVYITGEDRYYAYTGSAWVRIGNGSSSGRTRVELRRAATAQTIAANTVAFISWDTEDGDTDSFITVPSTTITVPAGLGGVYAISCYVTQVGGAGLLAGTRLSYAGHAINAAAQAISGTRNVALCAVAPVAAAATVQLAAYNSSGTDVADVSAHIDMVYIQP